MEEGGRKARVREEDILLEAGENQEDERLGMPVLQKLQRARILH